MGCAALPIGAVTFNETAATSDSTTPLVVKAASAGDTIYLTDITISPDTAMNIEVQDTDSTVVSEPMYFPATSIWSKTWSVPLVITADKGIQILGSLAGNVSVTITGYVR